MQPHGPIVVFSDVDSVLRYPRLQAWSRAANALKRLEWADVPLILLSKHSRAELEGIQQELGLHHPFVAEGGGAAFVSSGYFPFHVRESRPVAGYEAIEFGPRYTEVVRILRVVAERLRIGVLGFSDMSVEDVARECGLTLLQARLAKLREYSERFHMLDPDDRSRSRLFNALQSAGLRCTAGDRYDQVGAPVDNSHAVSLIRALYERAGGPVVVVGLADAEAEGTFLSRVDHRVLVSDADPAQGGIDVAGWAEAIVDIVEDLRHRDIASHPARMIQPPGQ